MTTTKAVKKTVKRAPPKKAGVKELTAKTFALIAFGMTLGALIWMWL